MNQIKQENRKALPRFFIMLAAAGIFGAVIGFASAFAADTEMVERVGAALSAFLTFIAPWGIPVSSLILLSLSFSLCRRAGTMAHGWDGEDEQTVETAEEKLSWALFWSNLLLLLDFFFVSLCPLYIKSLWGLVTILLFLLSFAGIMLVQQKVVDLERTLNPEKQGSIYDRNFHKKWIASCDEAEQRQIGQAAYKSYSTMNRSFPVVWCILTVLNFFFDTGLLPVLVVLVLWGISSTSYLLEAIRLGKTGR